MKTSLKILASILLVAVLLAWRAFTPPPALAGRVAGEKESRRKILIATQDYAFRNSVIQKLEEMIIGYRLDIIDIQDIPLRNPSDYSAIIVFDTVLAWSLHRNTNKLIGSGEDVKKKLVLVPCAGDPELKMEFPGVDVVSCPSPEGDVGKITVNILSRLNQILPADPGTGSK